VAVRQTILIGHLGSSKSTTSTSTEASLNRTCSTQAGILPPALTVHLDAAIADARAELGASYDAAATHGEKLNDDEVVHYLERVVADL
jgi:hypothetical protein